MDGYEGLSKYMAKHHEMMVFRKFLPLNAKNLLVMQAEILRLADSLEATVEADSKSGDPTRSQYQYNIGLMMGPHEDPENGAQREKTIQMRNLLKDYNETVLRTAAVLQLAPADKEDSCCVREALEKPDGSGERFLRSFEYFTYDEENDRDLTSLAALHKDKDILSRWIEHWVRKVYHKYIGRRIHDPISSAEACSNQSRPLQVHHYPDRYITTTIDTLSTILASALPAISALGLFFINDPLTRMVAIVILTVLFSTLLTLVARPTRAEMFAASAAFAAVLVVFVGGSNGSMY